MESMSKIVSQSDEPNSSSSVKESVGDSSSKEKKILPGRRQQRHSTEIGSEYHRWWVVRNALGFETNEHIAGLLLDGFHGLLQQLVHMCGGEDYQPYLPGLSKSQNEVSDGFDDSLPSLSPTSSSSPPGVIEDIEEFTEYKNAITHYCESLWRLCGLQDSRLQEVEKTSHPVQEFLVKLMGYLRAAKGKNYNLSHKKKRLKTPSQSQPKRGGEIDSSEIGTNVCPPPGASVDDMLLCPINTASLTLVPTSTISVQSETSNQDQEWIHGQLAPSPKSGKYSFIPIIRADKQTSSSGIQQISENSFVSESFSSPSQRDNFCNTETTRSSLNKMNKTKYGPLNVPEGQIGFQQLRQKPTSFNENLTITTCNCSPSQRQYENQKDGNHKTENQHQMLHDECSLHDNDSQTDVSKNAQAPNCNEQPQEQFGKQIDSQAETYFQDLQCHAMKAHHKYAPCKSDNRNASPGSSWNIGDGKKSITDATAEESDESMNAENYVSNADVEAHYEEEYLRLLLNQPSNISQTLVSDIQTISQFNGSLSSQQMTYNKSLDLETTCHNLSGETSAESVNKLKAVGKERHGGVFKPIVDTRKIELKENEKEAPNFATGPLVNLFNALSDNPSLQQKCFLANIKKKIKSKSLLETTNSSKCLVSEACVITTGEVNDARNSSKTRVQPRQKIALMVNDSKHQSGSNNVPKDPSLAIQPLLCPNLDKPHGISAPLGTPVIFYPANSFASTDNSLASLSSLVQNIVYNSHGTILKPLSLTPMTSLASNVTYNSQVISNTPASSDVGNVCKSVAAALPVLSSHLSAGKTTLVPFYISHMNTLSNLSKSSSLPSVTGLTHVKGALQSKGLVSSSTRLYQDWSYTNSKLTLSSDTSDWRKQLKITDVRSCSDTDFTYVNKGKHESAFLNGNDQAQSFMKQYNCNAVTSGLSSIPSPGYEFVNGWMHNSRQQEPNNHLTMSNSDTSSHPSPSTYMHSFIAPPPNTSTYPKTSTHQQGIFGNIKPHYKVTTKPQKKILTSLLANKVQDYSKSRENIYRSNTSFDQSIINTSLPSLATSSLTTSTSSAADKILCAHTQTSSESVNVKKKRSRRLLCSVCDLLFNSGTDLLVHRYEQHSHVCGECDGRFLSASRLKQHKEADHPSMMLCSHCRFHTFSKQGLAEHEMSKHGWKIDCKVEQFSELSQSTEANSSNNERELIKGTVSSIGSTKHTVCQQVCPEESNKHQNNMEQIIISQAHNNLQTKFIQSNSTFSDTAPVVHTPAINDNFKKNNSSALRETLGHNSSIILPPYTSESASYSSSFISNSLCDTGPPVFPSFNREVILKSGKDLASISAMYSQVSEHCRLDNTEISHASDHHFSETDEPQLVIDTEFCGSGKEDGTEGEIGKTERRPTEHDHHSDQPLCLVTHNRTLCRQPKNRSQTKRDIKKRKILNNGSHIKVSHILNVSGSEQAEREMRNSRKGYLENLSSGTQQNSEESSFFLTNSEIVNLPVTEEQKDKLVMKISLKQAEYLTADCKSLKENRKKRKNEASKVDNVIFAENLENVAQKGEEVLKLSASEKDNLNPPGANTTVSTGNRNNSRFKANSETSDYTTGGKHKTEQNVEQDVTKHDIVSNPINDSVDVLENALPQVLAVGKPEKLAEKQEKLLSLLDRHIMSSLPPKKRRLRRSSRCSKDEQDKLTEPVNQNLTENDTRDVRNSQSLSKTPQEVIKDSLMDTRNSEKRFKNVNKPTRFSGRCTRLSQFDKMSPTIDHIKFGSGNLISGRSRRNLVSAQLQGVCASVSFSSHRYACPIDQCEATFSRKWNLDGHIGKVHSKLSNVSCSVPECMQKFSSRKDQRQHITMDHKGKTRKYKCSWPDCNKGFFARTHLRIHNLTHTGEKPVACDICDYRCRQRTALIWHMRKHGIFQNDNKVSNSGNQSA